MSQRISAYRARTRFGEVLDAVRYRKEPVIVEKNGKPAAVIVDLEAYQALEALREEERFIEDYTEGRIREFFAADRLSKVQTQRIKKYLKSDR